MANVLGTLFSDIANAIRNKTGTTEKMSPNDFPIQINNIVVGGGNSDKQWKFATGNATGTGGAITITHNLGDIPDIICVRVGRNTSDTTAFIGSLQFSNSLIEAMNGTGNMYENGLGFVLAGVGPVALNIEEGVEGEHKQYSGMWGQIRNANATTFTVGGGSLAPIPSGRDVYWFAVSGIT